ncbi:gamma-glutamylcyclotransferase family protein [Thermodesulfitimonas sp.]
MTEKVFVYGTLLRGRANHRLLQGARFVGQGKVEGLALYAVTPFYPGAVPEAREVVLGEVYAVTAELLSVLDDFEDNGKLYQRVKYPVFLAAGGVTEAWVYIWCRQVRPEQKIPLEAQPWYPARLCAGRGNRWK